MTNSLFSLLKRKFLFIFSSLMVSLFILDYSLMIDLFDSLIGLIEILFLKE